LAAYSPKGQVPAAFGYNDPMYSRRTFPAAVLLCGLSLFGCTPGESDARPDAPFHVVDGLLDQAQPETLGLTFAPGAETHTIFRPGPDDDRFAHGVVLMPFRGRLYAQWQSSARDEDGPDTRVRYSVSDDGVNWSPPRELAPSMEDGIRTSGGWWTDGETLVAYINTWPEVEGQPVGGHTMARTSTDGETWSELRPVTDANGKPVAGVIEQDPHRLPDGRIVTAFHVQPGLMLSPWYTDDPTGLGGWTQGRMENLPHADSSITREIEPSWFLKPDGSIVMVLRDQAESFHKLAAVSRDRGETWTTPVLTNVPDSRSKQSAGNLPDGTAYLVGNPTDDRERFPLAILLSRDGTTFDRAWLLRSGGADLQPRRFEGQYKRAGFSYPKSVLWGEHLYVAYATNKEDVELTRVPVASLAP